MLIYNTLTQKKELIPEHDPIRMFVCGPTVYGDPHIGNARTFVTFDMFVRFLRSQGKSVSYIQNITDVEDKIIRRAEEEGATWDVVAKKYTEVYLANMQALKVTSVDTYAPATEYIPQIVAQVKTLIEKKNAYLIEGDGWYFDLTTFPDYGKLAHRTVEQAEDGTSRIDMSDKKRNRGDFALWKFSKENEPSWETELGAGRPGWHIEDTAITEHFYGPQYDIHGGAIDLKFPHHEAEIAQQESASGLKPFVRLWMHAGFLTVNGQKMSKSLKNFITIDALLAKHSADVFRMMILMHHYRSPFDYTNGLAENARKNISTIAAFVRKLEIIAASADETATPELDPAATQYPLPAEILFALDDDFNTPKALAAVFTFIGDLQPKIWTLPKNEAASIAEKLIQLFETFGITLPKPEISANIMEIVEARELSRRSKQFAQSDALRKELDGLGYDVEDTPKGAFVWPKG